MSAIKLFLLGLLTLLSSMVQAGSQQMEQLAADVQAAMRSSIINPLEPHLVFSEPQQADMWLQDMSRRLRHWVPDGFLRKRLLVRIQYEAVRAGLDPQIVLSVITVESRFNKYALSTAGAQGIMQVMPFWLRQIGSARQSLLNVDTNIRFGCTILRFYLRQERGNLERALQRYNGSLGNSTYSNKVLSAYNRYWITSQSSSALASI
jgi:soluble lytic murein transglycosylase-like protein